LSFVRNKICNTGQVLATIFFLEKNPETQIARNSFLFKHTKKKALKNSKKLFITLAGEQRKALCVK